MAKTVPCSSWRDAPSAPVIGVRPEKVADWTFMRHLLDAIKLSDLVQRIYAGGETAMKTENLVFHDGGQWQKVEQLRENFPNVCISILPQALIVEAITT